MAFVNPSGWQIISAGKDLTFGQNGNWSSVDTHGKDDLANFSTTYLGAGPN